MGGSLRDRRGWLKEVSFQVTPTSRNWLDYANVDGVKWVKTTTISTVFVVLVFLIMILIVIQAAIDMLITVYIYMQARMMVTYWCLIYHRMDATYICGNQWKVTRTYLSVVCIIMLLRRFLKLVDHRRVSRCKMVMPLDCDSILCVS